MASNEFDGQLHAMGDRETVRILPRKAIGSSNEGIVSTFG